MADRHDIVVPELGESVVEATVAEWLKSEGDRVQIGDILLELETDKVNLEVGADHSGVLAKIQVAAGEDVAVGDVLGQIEAREVEADEEPAGGEGQEAEAAKATEADPGKDGRRKNGRGKPEETEASDADRAATPVARRLAEEADLDISSIRGTGPRGRVTREDVEREMAAEGGADEDGRPSEEGEDVKQADGDGRSSDEGDDVKQADGDGRSSDEGDDVKQADAAGPESKAPEAAEVPGSAEPRDAKATGGAAAQSRSTPASRDGAASTTERPEERQRMSRRRRTIAERLVESQRTAAMLTTFNDVDMGPVMDLRRRVNPDFQERHGVKLGITTFFLKASVVALKEFPEINAEIDGDDIVYKGYYDIGVAIGHEEGLVVPVVRNVDRLSFVEVERTINDYVQKARDNALSVEDLRGGTFSITNGGVFGSLLSTPILNPPQVGILGLHRIEERPVAEDGEVVVRPMMYMALSYDHRIVDGREAVQFLARIKALVEDPGAMLVEG